ncbi:hypothetical protein FA95DRAFT_1631525 [Auriscalpium vulgare]|uniref:Uncharacterized protein n=1 Tax=Auriscalpium vulgare TaxID=40419 RepID=A0ACB8RGW9_9AGAM|nr:hypothetical protein FA95DRAFT_1631525 [Auriscalpium vulgare]
MATPSTPPTTSAALTLLLTPDNVADTTLTTLAGEPLYTVSTLFHAKQKPVTTLMCSDGTRTASWVWRVNSDLLTLGARPEKPAATWLHSSWVPYVRTMRFTDDAGRKFRWEGFSPGGRPQLFIEGTPQSIATFRPYPAALILDSTADGVRNLVVVSFLLLERRRRDEARAKEARAWGRLVATGYSTET